MQIENWKTQLRKGYLAFYLMALLNKKEGYGASILTALHAVGLMITDGTLYALLGRLSREGLIVGRWVAEMSQGHPRKYYRLTPQGEQRLQAMKQEWELLTTAIYNQREADHEDKQPTNISPN